MRRAYKQLRKEEKLKKGKGEKERYMHINVRQNSEEFSECINDRK